MTKSFCRTGKYGTYWYSNGKLHRENGPAIENIDGTKRWFLNGYLHREDGPAVERPNRHKVWYLNGSCITIGDRPENWDELVLLAQVEQVMND